MRPKERLLRKRIPKEEIRKELERWSDRLSHWNQFFTAIVVGGLAIEYLPDIASFFGIFSHAVFVILHEHANPLHQFGGLLVVVGVAGELWIDVRESKVETDLREDANSTIGELHARAAKAEKEAAEANLARVEIQKQLFKPHLLTEESKDELREILDKYTHGRKRIDVFVYDQHLADVFTLADSIHSAFGSAKWISKLWIGPEPRISGAEVTFAFAANIGGPEHALQQLAWSLCSVLKKLDIGTCVSFAGFSTTRAALPLGGWGIWDPKDVAVFRVQVGQRQLTDLTWPVAPPQAEPTV